MARAQVGRCRQAARLFIDQRAQVGDPAIFCCQAGGETGNHLAVLHPSHQVAQVRRCVAGQYVVAGDVEEVDFRMLTGSFPHAVFHIIRIADDQLRAFIHQLIDDCRNRQSGPVSGVHFVDIDHFAAGKLRLDIAAAFVMRLAPAVIVVGTDQQHTESQLSFVTAENGRNVKQADRCQRGPSEKGSYTKSHNFLTIYLKD